jgi:hypothetical protein
VILYEVNIEVDRAILPAFRTWLNEHVRDVLALPGFVSAEMFELRGVALGARRCSLCVQYRLAELADLDRYLRIDAPRMRSDGETRFPGQFSASRRILQPLASD